MTLATYARKSNDKKTDSVENQFAIIESYIREQKELKSADIIRFYDDGETGMNIQRDGFERLLTKVRSREIDVLVVKDLSRLGRNYLDVIQLTESIFPFMGVRVIAVCDSYDSKFRNPNQPLDLPTAIKAVLNEFYVTENAEKIRKSVAFKIRNGGIYGELPYGYFYGKNRKPQTDPEKAETVREIFRLADEGMKTLEIARELNSRGIPTLHGSKWTVNQVHKTLTNENYIGIRKSLKTVRDLKTRRWKKTESSEIFTNESAFPVIIEKEFFEKVQKLFTPKTRIKVPQYHIMARKLFCGHCGKTLARPRNFYCRKSYTTGEKRCFEGGLKPEVLYPDVLEKVRSKIRAELSGLPPRYSAQTALKTENEIAVLKEKRAEVFTLFLEKEIEESVFVRRKTALAEQIDRLQNTLSECRKSRAFYAKAGGGEHAADTLKRLCGGDTLTEEHMKFVERIDVFSSEDFVVTLFDESVINVLNKNISIYEEI